MRAGGHRLRAGIAAAGIAAAGHGLRAGKLPGRAAHIGRPSACPLRFRPCRFPGTPSSCPASTGRAVVARGSSGPSGACAPFGGWGRCGRLFSTPPWCQAGWSRKPGGLCRRSLLAGGDLKTGPSGRLGRKRPRAPRKRGACAAVKTAALPVRKPSTHNDLSTISDNDTPIPPPFPTREGGEGSRIRFGGESPAGGQRCGAGYGLRAGERPESDCCSVRGRP